MFACVRQIRRPYFHVKPLEKAQLRNWREYLDFEVEQGAHERIVILFERCLIACALYEEFWLKVCRLKMQRVVSVYELGLNVNISLQYVKYMRKHSADAVRNIFRRACEVHLPKKSSMHLAWAAFEEAQGLHHDRPLTQSVKNSSHIVVFAGNMAAVAKIFDKLDKAAPGLVVTSLRRIGVERRQGNSDATLELHRKFAADAMKPDEKTFFTIKYARYLVKVKNAVQYFVELDFIFPLSRD